mmetsp:Transcript_1410/g.2357  ORF Transcript_1410/g.2357 Transcript_1410/m.2357 type:complete len:97 (+) Transcript_1410:3-293(+)
MSVSVGHEAITNIKIPLDKIGRAANGSDIARLLQSQTPMAHTKPSERSTIPLTMIPNSSPISRFVPVPIAPAVQAFTNKAESFFSNITILSPLCCG